MICSKELALSIPVQIQIHKPTNGTWHKPWHKNQGSQRKQKYKIKLKTAILLILHTVHCSLIIPFYICLNLLSSMLSRHLRYTTSFFYLTQDASIFLGNRSPLILAKWQEVLSELLQCVTRCFLKNCSVH